MKDYSIVLRIRILIPFENANNPSIEPTKQPQQTTLQNQIQQIASSNNHHVATKAKNQLKRSPRFLKETSHQTKNTFKCKKCPKSFKSL